MIFMIPSPLSTLAYARTPIQFMQTITIMMPMVNTKSWIVVDHTQKVARLAAASIKVANPIA